MFFNEGNKNKKMFNICFISTICFMIIFSFLSLNKSNSFFKHKFNEASVFTPTNKKENTSNISLLAVGDTMVYNSQLKSQYDSSSGTYDFKNNFTYVKKYIEKADYSMLNLETTLTGNKFYRYSSYPKFNSPDELADGLKYAGFDLISTANNHAYDKGDLSIENTINTLKNKNLDVVGTENKNNKNKFIIKNIKDIKIGITSYTFGKHSHGNTYLDNTKVSQANKSNINVFDSSSVDNAFEDINSTLNQMKDTDLQVVYLHWGDKYSLKENAFQKQLAQKLCDAGVDVIIGSHPHVVQPVESIKSTDKKNETIVAYSLGNFLSNQTRDQFNQYTEDGLMLNIDIIKNKDNKKTTIKKVNCIPTYLNKYYNNRTYKYVYEIIPIDDKTSLQKINNVDNYKLKNSYNNTASQIKTDNIISIVENPFN